VTATMSIARVGERGCRNGADALWVSSRGYCVPVPVVLRRLVMLGRVLGFCATNQRASMAIIPCTQRTGHCDGFMCRIVGVMFVEAGRRSSILQESVARLPSETR
jgi:hypothetical protein